MDPADVDATRAYVTGTLGEPREWVKWPGGWSGDIAAALIDAVFSARAVYSSKHGKGVLALVKVWRSTHPITPSGLDALLADIDAVGVHGWATEFGSAQVSPSRPATAPGGRTKAATVRQAAAVLVAAGISTSSQIDTKSAEVVKRALRSVPGIGYATANYFLMLLNVSGVKPDRMVHRFLREATGHEFTDAGADAAVTLVAEQLGVQPHELDHAMWAFESARS